jgi:hypothetical protein
MAFYPFVEERPWRFWSDDTLARALEVLEGDRDRTIEVIGSRRAALDRAITNLFIRSSTSMEEGRPKPQTAQELVALSTLFLPEYLRWAEHVFGNLLELFWAVSKRGATGGQFNLRGALSSVESAGHGALLEGFDERVRNAIAHGKVRFRAFEIEFGATHPVRLSAPDFLMLLDSLVRTCNALSLAVMLFWEKNRRHLGGAAVPLSMVTRFAAGAVNRTGLQLTGAVESEIPLVGRQLHVAITLNMRARPQVQLECARIGVRLLEAGATGYDRFAVSIDHGEPVNSLVFIMPKPLAQLLESGAPADRLPEIFDKTQLLWWEESAGKTRMRAWAFIARMSWAKLCNDIQSGWRTSGIWIGKGRYRVRDIEDLSVGGIARVRLVAVLRNPDHADDVGIVNEVVHELAKTGRRMWRRSRSRVFDKGVPWPRRPQHVFVDVYRHDGPVRWLRSGGWMAGNLVAVGEKVWKGRDPVLVTKPETIHKGVRIRYRMDQEEFEKAFTAITELAQKIWRHHSV